MKLDSLYQDLTGRLERLRRRQKRLALVEGFVKTVTVVLGVLFLVLALEAIFHFRPPVRRGLLLFWLGVTSAGIFWFCGRPLVDLLFRRNAPDDISLALRVGRHLAHIRDRLADALQVFEKHRENPEGYSLELSDASLKEVYDEVKTVDFSTVASSRPVRDAVKLGAGVLAVSLALALVFFTSFSAAANRLLHPARAFGRDATLALDVQPGDVEVVKGESVELRAVTRGAAVARVWLFTKKQEATEFERLALAAKDSLFSFTVANLDQDLQYYFEAGRIRSPEFKVTVIEPPMVRSLQLRLTYPAYSKLGSQFLEENVGDVTALPGTRVRVSLQTNKPVQRAQILFSDSTATPLKITDRQAKGEFVLRKGGRYHIGLKDAKGLVNPSPIDYRLAIVADQSPVVEITFPGRDVDLNKDMLLPLTIEAQDDFGFSRIRLGYKIFEGGIQEGQLHFLSLPIARAQDKILLNYTWDLSELKIFPGDLVSYYAEAFDNDTVSGPKRARSTTYRVRFPSIYEIYDEVARSQEESYDELEQLYEESQDLKTTLDDVVRQMKRDPNLNWEEKQEIQESAQKQQEMQQKLQEVESKLEQMVNRMQQNDLLSYETLEKYRELQNLMEEMLTDELKQALRELQKSLEELDQQKMKEAMEKFASSQEEFLKGLERTLDLLKKLQIEQKLDESIRKAQELRRRQEELNKQMSAADKQARREKYAREQRGVRRDTENLESELEQLENKMNEFPQMPQDKVEAARDQLGEQALQRKMQEAAQQLRSGDPESARKSGEQISQGLQDVIKSLQSAKRQLSAEQKKKVQQALRRSSHDLLDLSKRQERLMKSTRGTDRNSPEMNELADKQEDLLSGLSRITNQLTELSKETFFVTPEMGRALGKSVRSMQEALQGFEARNSVKSSRGQAQAMSGLNQAAAEIRNSLQSLSGAASAIGFEEMMQRLMGISNQQQGLNQRTSELGKSPGGLSPEQQAAMSRLAAEQNALRKSLEQLLKEAGNRSELLGDLGKVTQDMEEVVKELQKKRVDRRTIDRQKRILSRLLDAQRSIHQRDFSKKRRAETAKRYQPASPPELPETPELRRERLKNELLKALKEGYSRDYRELIQKYFEALAREQQEGELNN